MARGAVYSVAVEDKALLLFLQKALGSKAAANPIKGLEAQPGPFDVQGTFSVRLSGSVGESYDQDKYYGVEIDELFNILIASLPGFMENTMRKACAIAVEIKRASIEGRSVRDSQWTAEDGEIHFLFAEEIIKASTRIEEMKERAKQAIAPFSEAIKVTRPAAGPVNVEIIEITQLKKAA
jgi:hypothetical protein